MLGYLRGKILSKSPESNHLVVLAHRIGFEVVVPARLFDRIEAGRDMALWIHSHVREDAFTLFGFETEAEKNFFRILIGVSGLGPKTALSLLGEHGAEKLTQLILAKRSDDISEAPGVGKKLAQRLILELSSKVEKLAWLKEMPKAEFISAPTVDASQQLREDLASALGNLGYTPQQVKLTLDKLMERVDSSELGFSGLLKAALGEMSGRPARPKSNTEASSHV